ncbi:MAG: ABC transporter permease [Phycisphaeraceae bacterium]|nr:ABC transporter permease [Phycisphaeraceae bacterium]
MPEPGDKPDRGGGVLGAVLAPIEFIGGRTQGILDHIGSMVVLTGKAMGWVSRAMFNRKVRIGRAAIVTQMVRVGVRSLLIISLVSSCIGLILALQLAPPLDEFGQKALVANIVGVAVLRELGPLIAAVVLTGFAGAAIAAEIGTMVVGEEIEALEAHALNPVRFLVVPRIIAATVSMTCLAVVADFVAIVAALATAMLALDIPYATFMTNFYDQVKPVDFWTGVGKGAVFGFLIGVIACGNGLQVTGGAAGVGKATTATVVESVVAIIITDMIFTAVFYALGLV